MTAPSLHLTWPYVAAFYTGTASSTVDVPARFHLALAGRGYLIDRKSDQMQQKSIPLLKGQLGSDSDEVGEGTVNPEGAWRRGWDSWHLGAGQNRRDDKDSISQQYRTSKGIDPWTRGQISLLHDTTQHVAAASTTTMPMASTDTYIYWVSDTQQIRRTDLTTDGACTGEPAANVTSLCSTGKRVYAAFGASGVYRLNADNGTVFASFEASTATLVGWAKGRVLSAGANVLRDISTGTAVTLLTHADTSFVWAAITEGTSHIYAAGNSGDKALIYRTATKPDGTALDVPVVCGRLPDGETITALYGVLSTNVIVIGTSRGFRVAEQASNGDLTIGPLVDLNVSVRAFVARGQYVWFGWTNYDSTSTGVGRMDLQHFTEDLVPAYASDLMVTGQGTVDGLAYLGSNLAIGVAALGIYKPHTDLVATGTLETGHVAFGLVEDKLFTGGQLGMVNSTTGSGLSISVEGGAFTTFDETGETERGSRAELRITLARDGSVTTNGPTVESLLLTAYPAVTRTEQFVDPLILQSVLTDLSGGTQTMDVDDALDEIRGLVLSGQITTRQIGTRSWVVRVEDYVWQPLQWNETAQCWEGTCITRSKAVVS